MATGAIAHLKYDLDNYITALRRVSSLAATFLISDSLIRKGYITEVEDFILSIEQRFKSELYPPKKIAIIEELKAEKKLAEKEYQILRMKDYTTYIITDIFEDQGVIKYAKMGGGMLSGSIQMLAGVNIARLGRQLNIKHFSGVGAVVFAHGGNNIYEALSPVLFEHKDSGLIRKIYRKSASMLGLDDTEGDLAYGFVDFSLSLYTAIRMPVLIDSPKRLASRGLGEKPGSGRLFYNVSKDFVSKWSNRNSVMKIYLGGSSIYKAKLEFVDGNYRFED